MVDVVVVGSVGIDTIETPYGKIADGLGGSAVYAALAASAMGALPSIVSVVGKDLPSEHHKFLKQQGIALDGLVTVDGPTFRWHGSYEFDMGVAKTLKTDLGSLAHGKEVTKGYQRLLDSVTPGVDKPVTSGFLLLANFDPEIQAKIAAQFRGFVVLDTMNFWIKNKLPALRSVIKHVDALVLNENEARELLATPNLVKAGQEALELGPEYVIIKKGEHGSMLFSEHGFFAVPGYPLLEPVDPTGAGDSFAGALVGWLASQKSDLAGRPRRSESESMRKALVYATAVSSFTVEGMGVSRLAKLKPSEIKERVEVFHKMRQF